MKKKLIDYKQDYENLTTKKNLSGNEALKAVEEDGYALQYVKDQSEAICLKAVERNGYALRYVKDQSEAICLKAVEEDGDALQYVKDQLFFDLQESKPLFILDGIEYSEGTARSMIKKATE